jgi:predicted nuclease of restriction endonuclease-like (RecB) superfamily
MKYAQLLKAIDSTSRDLLGRVAAAVNQALVIRNWLIGAYIVEFEQYGEDRAKYGAKLLARLATDLKERGVKGLSVQMLERTRQFYLAYPQVGGKIPSSLMREFPIPRSIIGPAKSSSLMRKFSLVQNSEIPSPGKTRSAKLRIPQPPVTESGAVTPLPAEAVLCLSWTKLIELIRIEDLLKRAFYENECLKGNWSVRQLQRQIGSLLYERTGLSKDKAAVIRRAHRQEAPAHVADLLRDPYVLEFTGLGERTEYTESDLEKALLDHLQQFLLELGTGFCFEARQKRITVGNKHDYIDLVFYQRRLRCHVLIDLKTRPFTHGDAGQMNFYLNWWKKNGMERADNPPVGIILCSDREKTEVEFATAGMDNKLFVSRYLVALPSAEQLREFVERDRERIEMQTRQGR